MALKVARFLNLMLASVLVGNEFGGWAGVHPALKTLPLSTQVAAEQAVTQRYGRLMPGVMLSAILSCIPVLSRCSVTANRWSSAVRWRACSAS